MKKNLNFAVGQEESLKGYAGKYRYVGTNRVRNCKSGQIISVRHDQIQPAGKFDGRAYVLLLAVIALIALIIYIQVR